MGKSSDLSEETQNYDLYDAGAGLTQAALEPASQAGPIFDFNNDPLFAAGHSQAATNNALGQSPRAEASQQPDDVAVTYAAFAQSQHNATETQIEVDEELQFFEPAEEAQTQSHAFQPALGQPLDPAANHRALAARMSQSISSPDNAPPTINTSQTMPVDILNDLIDDLPDVQDFIPLEQQHTRAAPEEVRAMANRMSQNMTIRGMSAQGAPSNTNRSQTMQGDILNELIDDLPDVQDFIPLEQQQTRAAPDASKVPQAPASQIDQAMQAAALRRLAGVPVAAAIPTTRDDDSSLPAPAARNAADYNPFAAGTSQDDDRKPAARETGPREGASNDVHGNVPAEIIIGADAASAHTSSLKRPYAVMDAPTPFEPAAALHEEASRLPVTAKQRAQAEQADRASPNMLLDSDSSHSDEESSYDINLLGHAQPRDEASVESNVASETDGLTNAAQTVKAQLRSMIQRLYSTHPNTRLDSDSRQSDVVSNDENVRSLPETQARDEASVQSTPNSASSAGSSINLPDRGPRDDRSRDGIGR